MNFNEFNANDFDLEFTKGAEIIHHATLSKNGDTYYLIDFPFNQGAYDIKNYELDLKDFKNNATLKIQKPIFSKDEKGDFVFEEYETIFSGSLKEAQNDERFKDFEINTNVRAEQIIYANPREYTHQHKQSYSNFEKRQYFEEALNHYDDMLKSNKDFNALHSAYVEDERIDKEILKNDKEIIEKEQEIKLKQEKLDELERQKNKQAHFNAQDLNQDDPLAREKQELQALKEKSMALKEQKIQCEQSISESVGKIASANDIYELYKNLINIYRKLKEAEGINKNLQYNKERMKELDDKINNYTQKLNDILKIAGMSKEGKELINQLTKDLYKAQQESQSKHNELKQEHDFHKKLDLLFTQRKSTTNLKANTQEIEKLIQRIQKEAPNFEKNYANSFKADKKLSNKVNACITTANTDGLHKTISELKNELNSLEFDEVEKRNEIEHKINMLSQAQSFLAQQANYQRSSKILAMYDLYLEADANNPYSKAKFDEDLKALATQFYLMLIIISISKSSQLIIKGFTLRKIVGKLGKSNIKLCFLVLYL